MSRLKSILLSVSYSVVLFLFSIYSFSQIDLNLTLWSNTFYQSIQNQLIQLGYFNRPVSASIFLFLIFSLFFFYYVFLTLAKKNLLKFKDILHLILISSGVLFFSYPAFSHDIFNYMFDARIVTKYFSNPYITKALDYQKDLWTRFMHWTHRTYPYGPVWLFITIPFSFLGFGKFTLTLLNFKLMFLLFHLANIYLIHKILKKTKPKQALLAVVFYSFNPLILIESILSPHNEVMMLFFLLLSIYFGFVKKNFVSSFLSLLVSAGVKFITIVALPILIIFSKMKKLTVEKAITYVFLLIAAAVVYEMKYRESYPWYFIIPLGVGSLMVWSKQIYLILFALSLSALLRYFPFLYYGEYTSYMQNLKNILFATPLLASFFLILVQNLKKRLKATQI